MEKELRSYEFDVRAENDEKQGHMLSGMPIVFDATTDLGWFFFFFAPGALDAADLRDVKFLVNHNIDMIPLARSRRNNENSTMQLMIGSAGMDIRVDLDTENNADARALYSSVERGDISGMSFMFTVDRDEWHDLDTNKPTRVIKEISRVFEVSAVTFPAYEQTSITARSAEDTLERAKAALESARQKAEELAEAKRKYMEVANET